MNAIEGQVMYLGPHVAGLGLYFSKTWRNGVEKELMPMLKHCPAIGSLIVPVADIGKVLRSLNFDYAHNMRGTTGPHVRFYREVQQWLASTKTASKPLTMKHK
jgi:hypothetical protein